MTSHNGGRSSEPPPPQAALYDDLVGVRERAVMLQTVLQGSPVGDAGELMQGMMTRLSSAFSRLGANGGGVVAASGAGSAAATASGAGRRPGGRRTRAGAAAGPVRRSSGSRRRSKSPFIKTETVTTPEDGQSWRKYGQKFIHKSTNPRSYYRCTHKHDQGCKATKQVQKSESNPSEFVISYFGEHTCKDPSTLHLEGAAAPPDHCANLIDFSSINNGTAATASTSAFPHSMLFPGISYSSLPAQGLPAFCEKLTQAAADQVAAEEGQRMAATVPLTVGSAPAEYWPAPGEMDAVDAGISSFPSSPSSLGFTGSFGSFGDDDLFGFDS